MEHKRFFCKEIRTHYQQQTTPYYRLQHRRATFDGVIALRVEGVSISAISRIEGIAWNTDGFEFYQKVIRRFFGPACLYGQVLKTLELVWEYRAGKVGYRNEKFFSYDASNVSKRLPGAGSALGGQTKTELDRDLP